MRATPLLAAVALLVVAILGWWWFRAAGPAIAATADRNVLLVTIDTLRADALGSYGGRATTPNLDRLAAGLRRLAAALRRRLDHDRATISTTASSSPALRWAPGWITRLALAADAFVFARPLPSVPDGQSIIAGYPWFGDWGRDTMISLPGLTLATGRADIARRILKTFASFVSEGMLPNVFPGAGDHPAYNTADASLWFFEAWRAYVDATGDIDSLREVFATAHPRARD